MRDSERPQKSEPDLPEASLAKTEDNPKAQANTAGEPPKLTADEQMALYEDYLKETDWGHQPC